MKGKRGKGKIINWKIWIILAVIFVILITGIFFGVKAYKKLKTNENMEMFQQGFTYGYTSAVLQIMNISDTCQPFPVYVGNQTRTLISLDCLNR